MPLLYINRSVLIMEPMADVSWEKREREEWGKFTIGLKEGERRAVEASARGEAAVREEEKKRKREDGGDEAEGETEEGAVQPAMRRRKGPKGPNPLSVRKKKALPVRFLPNPTRKKAMEQPAVKKQQVAQEKSEAEGAYSAEAQQKRKRKRKHGGSKRDGENEDEKANTEVAAST